MNRRSRLLGLVAVVALLAGLPALAGAQAGTAPAGTAPAGTASATATAANGGVSGNNYTSPTYGYRLSWNPLWRVESATSQSKVDVLELNDNVSDITFQGSPARGRDAKACLNGVISQLKSTQGFTEVTAAKGNSGKALAGGDASDAWAVYDFVYTPQAGGSESNVTAYLECYAMPSVQGVLQIAQFVEGGKYNDEIPARSALFDSLKLPGTNGTAQATAAVSTAPVSTAPATATAKAPGIFVPHLPATSGTAPAATASSAPFTLPTRTSGSATTAGNAGVSGSTYTSPTYGYGLKWDSTWTVKSATSRQGVDLLSLSNGTSTLTVRGFHSPATDAKACLQAEAASSQHGRGVSNFSAAQAQGGGALAGGDATASWAVYDYQVAGSNGQAQDLTTFLKCYALGSSAFVAIAQVVPSDSYNDQIQARSTLLNTLQLPAGAAAAGAAPAGTAPAGPTATAGALDTGGVLAAKGAPQASL